MARSIKSLFTLALWFLFSFPIPAQITAKSPTSTPGIENAAALTNFFKALDAGKTGKLDQPVLIMQFGDSHTAADILTAEIRRRVQVDFGNGGPGFLVPQNPMSTRRRGVTSGASSGWMFEGIGGRIAPDGIYGPAGVALGTTQPNERVWLQTVATHFEVYYVAQPGGGSIDIKIDGVSALDEPLSLAARTARVNIFAFDDPSLTTHRIEVATLTPGKVRLLGIVAEQANSGAVFDVFGINGARASRLLNWNGPAFNTVLAQRKPNLIILAFGTNEAGDADWTPLAYEQLLGRVLQRLHAAAPDASILIYAPPDRADLPLAARRMPFVVQAQRRAAVAGNAAFWSSYAAMGGAGSMRLWEARGLAQADHVHLTSAGYARLADLFYDDLMNAYEARQSSVNARP
jgi:lysophospholipase L1-like esterase